MAQALPFIQAAAAVAAVGGTAASIHQSRKAQRAQEKADDIARAQAEIQNQRQIRQNIIRSRAMQAQLIAQGQTQTGSFGGSSAVTGALGSAQTQQAANTGFGLTTIAAGNSMNRQQTIANRAASNAATFGAIANLPGQFGFDLGSMIKNSG